MAVASPPAKKAGVGIEFTVEALVAILRQRFPNLVDWDHIPPHSGEVDASPQVGQMGIYFTFPEPDEWADDIVAPTHVIAEGAPVPTLHLRLSDVEFADGEPRCGFGIRDTAKVDRPWVMCARSQDHDGEHQPV